MEINESLPRLETSIKKMEASSFMVSKIIEAPAFIRVNTVCIYICVCVCNNNNKINNNNNNEVYLHNYVIKFTNKNKISQI